MPVGLSQFYQVVDSGADRIMMSAHGDGLLGTPDKTSFNGYSLEDLNNFTANDTGKNQISAKKEFASFVRSNMKVLNTFKEAIEDQYGTDVTKKLDKKLFSPKTSLTPERFKAIMKAVNKAYQKSIRPSFLSRIFSGGKESPEIMLASIMQDVPTTPIQQQQHNPPKRTYKYQSKQQTRPQNTSPQRNESSHSVLTTPTPQPRLAPMGNSLKAPNQQMTMDKASMPKMKEPAPLKLATGVLKKEPIVGKPGVERSGAQTCYLGSTINMLFHTPGYQALFDESTVNNAYQVSDDLAPDIQQRNQNIQELAGLMRLAFEDLEGDGVSQDMVSLIFQKMQDLDIVPKRATPNHQMDIEEVLNELLDIYTPSSRLQEKTITRVDPTSIQETNKDVQSHEYSAVDDAFHTPTLSQPSSILKLPIGKASTLQECLNNYQKTEVLDDFAIRQNGHKANCTARRRIQLSGTPPQLTINLKRHTDHQSKIQHQVEIPQTFKLNGANYELRAMAFHHGDHKGGHYTTAVKDGDDWIQHDDQHSHKITGGLFGPGNDGYRNGGYLYTYVKVEDV